MTLSNEAEFAIIRMVCDEVVRTMQKDDADAIASHEMLGYVGAIHGMHTHVYVSLDQERDLLEAEFKYEDPTGGDVVGITFRLPDTNKIAWDGDIADVIADQIL